MSSSNLAQIEEWIETEDRSVSARLLRLRNFLKMSTADLASVIGIEEKELISYENGSEAVPASIIALFSICLGVNMQYFYEDSDDILEVCNYVLEFNN